MARNARLGWTRLVLWACLAAGVANALLIGSAYLRLRAEQSRAGTEAGQVHVGHRFVSAIGTYARFTREGDLPLVAVHCDEIAAQLDLLSGQALCALAERHAPSANMVEQVAERDALHGLPV